MDRLLTLFILFIIGRIFGNKKKQTAGRDYKKDFNNIVNNIKNADIKNLNLLQANGARSPQQEIYVGDIEEEYDFDGEEWEAVGEVEDVPEKVKTDEKQDSHYAYDDHQYDEVVSHHPGIGKMTRQDLKRAVIMSEVLSKPVALRKKR